MKKNLLITFKGKNSEKVANYFVDWFFNEGEFKFLDFIDSKSIKIDYSDIKITINKIGESL